MKPLNSPLTYFTKQYSLLELKLFCILSPGLKSKHTQARKSFPFFFFFLEDKGKISCSFKKKKVDF